MHEGTVVRVILPESEEKGPVACTDYDLTFEDHGKLRLCGQICLSLLIEVLWVRDHSRALWSQVWSHACRLVLVPVSLEGLRRRAFHGEPAFLFVADYDLVLSSTLHWVLRPLLFFYSVILGARSIGVSEIDLRSLDF